MCLVNEGAGARGQEKAKFYGRIAVARPGEVGNRESGMERGGREGGESGK